MEEEIEFNISPDELVFQKILLDIYKICDEIYFRENKKIDMPPNQKEKVANEVMDFLEYILGNMGTPLLRFKKKPAKKEMNELFNTLSQKIEKDVFSKYLLSRYVADKKIKPKNMPNYLTVSALILLSKGKPVDLTRAKKRMERIKPIMVRVACLISPFIELHEKIQKEIEKGEITVEKVLKKGKIDQKTLSYIG